MLEENNYIDNLFKSAIEPYEMTPSDKVWKSLDADLNNKRSAGLGKSGNRGMFLSIAVALFIVSFATYQVLSPSSYIRTTFNKKDNALQTNDKERGSKQLSESKVPDKKSVVSKDETNGLVVNNNISDNKQVNTHNRNINDAVGKAISKAAKGNLSTHSTASASKSSQPLYASADNSSGINHTRSDRKLPESKGNDSRKDNSSSTATGNNNTYSSNSSKQASTPDPIAPSATDNNNNSSKTSSVGSDNTENKAPNIDNTATGKSDATSQTPANENQASKASVPVKDDRDILTASVATVDQSEAAASSASGTDFGKNKTSFSQLMHRFSVDAYYAPEIANHTSINDASDASTITTMSDNFKGSYNTGLLLRFDLSNKLSVSLGCSYSTLDYSSSVSTSYIVPQSDSLGQFHLHGDLGNSNSSTSHFKDPQYFDHYFSTTAGGLQYHNSIGSVNLVGNPAILPANSANKPGDVVYFITSIGMQLKFINVPLVVTYKLSKKRFDYYIDAGVAMDLLVDKLATVKIGDAYTETTHNIDGLRKTSYSLQFGVGARYHLYKEISLFMEPGYRRAITPITQGNSNGFYPYYIGLNTGISFHF